jgi:chemotaxis signal transduction protein/ABC-type nitrate/sulfonate/bicarbonate transport system substrate-binding protein
MPGWNPVQQALETGDVDAAFILAPIAMDLYGYGAPIKLTLFAHKNGSISVKKRQNVDNNLMNFFEGRTFYIPHILSIHHMLSNQFLREIGLKPGVAGDKDVDVFFEVVPPINMPEFIASNESAGGFTVAEPLGTKTIAAGNAELLFLSGEMWEYHPCCVVCMRDEIIEQYPEAVQEFTDLLVKSGQFINDRVDDAAKIAVDFLDPGKKLGLNIAVLKNVLKEPQGIKTDDLFPVKEDLGSIQDYMSDEMGVGQKIDLDDFVLSSFADEACRKANSSRRPSVVHDVANVVKRVAERAAEQTDAEKLTNLDREGKYLVFNLDNQEYGVDIGTVREIVQMMKIKPIPRTPDYIKGVMNLRDKVIPVIDLRLTLGIEEKEYDQNTCIIILEVGGYQGTYQMGAVVDSVNEVLNIKATDIEDTPSFGVDINADFILAMAKTDGKVKTLLNTNRIFGQQESEMIGSIV